MSVLDVYNVIGGAKRKRKERRAKMTPAQRKEYDRRQKLPRSERLAYVAKDIRKKKKLTQIEKMILKDIKKEATKKKSRTVKPKRGTPLKKRK